ncbi:hypothetical protein EVAR_77499_1 [Eumeta japonica]|uniref:PiggyBac transposable element-derived protein domain-containing protein n=1 Tax=Eumeta variegata TaxID=151549 RepID=A0A4C1T7F4_EUMVA|nr:hypothetical protein EVAR_77499_1 [Eumeta japonica]
MPPDRFKVIMKFLRFDHRSERSSRLQQDKFALISDVWKKFIENCLSCYKPGENVTVNEQLFSTKEKMKAGHKTKASVNPLLCVSWNLCKYCTLHENVEIDSNHPKKKPKTVTFYNATKYGVDVADQMAKKYSVKTASRRWPVGINSFILYKKMSGTNIKRRNFILSLASELSGKVEIEPRPSETELSPEESTPSTSRSSLQNPESRKRRECYIQKCKNQTNKVCDSCKKPLCGSFSESLAAYGWYALGGVIAFLCAASYLRPVLDKWRQAREDAAYHKDPDRVAKRLEAEQRARELQQQQLAAASARALELQKEREEKKRAEAVERMARYGPSAGGQRLGSKGDDFFPLSHGAEGGSSYRPPKRSACSRGGCGR